MIQNTADAFTAFAVLTGLISAGAWWWSAHLQGGRSIGWNEYIKELDKRIVKANAWAAILTGVSVAAQAVATVLGRLVPPPPH